MKVLLAVDSIVFGKITSDFVANYNWPPETEFKVVHVIDQYGQELAKNRTQVEHDARILTDRLVAIIKEHLPDSQVSNQIVHGMPEQEILASAKAWKADMIVLGSHSKSEIARLLLGSVSIQVAMHAPCSVVVLRLPLPTEVALKAQSEVANVKF